MKIAPATGGGLVMSCRSDSAAESAFDDSADRRRSEDNKRKKGEPGAVALEKNVLNRCHHLDDENSGGSRKKPGMQSNNFLHDNDFTFIDADDDPQSIADEVLDAGRSNGCKSSDNASSLQNALSAGRESLTVENQRLSGGE